MKTTKTVINTAFQMKNVIDDAIDHYADKHQYESININALKQSINTFIKKRFIVNGDS